MADTDYQVYTNLDPQTLTLVGKEIFKKWAQFALGKTPLGGHTLESPTGRYASAISFRQYGASHVAIIADEKKAPEAAILETGHRSVDLKQYLNQGQSYPMHRATPNFSPTLAKMSKKSTAMWAMGQSFTGFARVTDVGWVIPAMPAYSPAKHLVDLMRNEIRG